MNGYKQEVKERSRLEIWTRAVKSLTENRDSCRILNSNYIRRLWDYSFDEVLKLTVPDEQFIDSWTDFANSKYSSKMAKDLKVAYFCGPEPENDLDIMVSLGIRVENVWAIESDKKTYAAALASAKQRYPTLKIFQGTIAVLMEFTPDRFDIIYLDFTGSLFSQESKPITTINSVFENQSLSDLGILVINSALPDKTDENVKFLSGYFADHTFLESNVLSGDSNDYGYIEGADAHGYEADEFEQKIEENFEEAYSSFCTHYPPVFASYIQPMFRVASSPALKKIFLHSDENAIKKALKRMSTLDEEEVAHTGAELYEQPGEFPIWHFIDSLKSSKTKLGLYWYNQFTSKKGKYSYFDAVKLYDLLRSSQYIYKETLSESLSAAISKVLNALPDQDGGRFCDVPLPHLWVELALNQLGSAYHANEGRHWRAKYKAKTREMYLDMFVFDKCRPLYDWLPMLDLYGEDLVSIERQIIIRGCMDAITKQNHHSLFFSYYGANMIAHHERRWSDVAEIFPRVNLDT
jgi:hypothetical protein